MFVEVLGLQLSVEIVSFVEESFQYQVHHLHANQFQFKTGFVEAMF